MSDTPHSANGSCLSSSHQPLLTVVSPKRGEGVDGIHRNQRFGDQRHLMASVAIAHCRSNVLER